MKSDFKKFPIMLGLLIGGFIGMFSETVLNIALTSLMKDLHITASTVQWLTTGYLLVVGVLVPVSGLMIRWFTTRQLLLSALSAFIIGTLISAVSHTFTFLLIGRLVQGIAAGAMFICVQTTSSFLFVIAANLLLMIGAPLVMSPAQTNGLNALPKEMSPDGSAIMNTAQQVSGAIATALSATLLAAGEHAYTGAGGQHAAAALTNGVQYGFMFTLILAVIGFALSFTVRTVGVFEKPQDQQRKMQLKKETDSPC